MFFFFSSHSEHRAANDMYLTYFCSQLGVAIQCLCLMIPWPPRRRPNLEKGPRISLSSFILMATLCGGEYRMNLWLQKSNLTQYVRVEVDMSCSIFKSRARLMQACCASYALLAWMSQRCNTFDPSLCLCDVYTYSSGGRNSPELTISINRLADVVERRDRAVAQSMCAFITAIRPTQRNQLILWPLYLMT